MKDHIEFACMLAIEARDSGAVCDYGSTNPRASHLVARDAMALIKLARSFQRRALYGCNVGELTPAMERAEKRDGAKAAEIAARYGAKVETGGDPRGFTLKLLLKSGRSNSFGGEGWGVPT